MRYDVQVLALSALVVLASVVLSADTEVVRVFGRVLPCRRQGRAEAVQGPVEGQVAGQGAGVQPAAQSWWAQGSWPADW